jgi:hypothetical protein
MQWIGEGPGADSQEPNAWTHSGNGLPFVTIGTMAGRINRTPAIGPAVPRPQLP